MNLTGTERIWILHILQSYLMMKDLFVNLIVCKRVGDLWVVGAIAGEGRTARGLLRHEGVERPSVHTIEIRKNDLPPISRFSRILRGTVAALGMARAGSPGV